MDIFVSYGKSDTPVAIIQDGTTEREKIVIGQVKDIYFRSQHAGMSNPSIIVVGEVVNLHPSILTAQLEKASLQKEAQTGTLNPPVY